MSKKILLLGVLALTFCADGSVGGVNQDFIRKQFSLSPSADKAVISVKGGDTCPSFEFTANNDNTFQVRRGPDDPPLNQSTFSYKEDQYSEDGPTRILEGSNDSNTTYKLTYVHHRYTIEVDYECANSTDKNCVRTNYECSGALVE